MSWIKTTLLVFIALIGVLFSTSFASAEHLDDIKDSGQSDDNNEPAKKTTSTSVSPLSSNAITEQIVGKRDSDSITGYVARTPYMSDRNENVVDREVALPNDETRAGIPARNVMLGFMIVAFVALVGFLVSQYHGRTSTKKGTVWIGPKARTRVIREPMKERTKKVRFNKHGTEVSLDLETYLQSRKGQATTQVKTAKRSNPNVSSYEDEYWQHQKESFWKRVRIAADTPMSIQQLAVKRVQQYNEKMAEIRQAKEDLYVQKSQATKDFVIQEPPPVEQKGVSSWGGQARRAEQQLIIDQLKEAHTL